MEAIEIKSLRENMGISQEALAHVLSVSFQTINRWERGINKPSRLAIEKIKALKKKGKVK